MLTIPDNPIATVCQVPPPWHLNAVALQVAVLHGQQAAGVLLGAARPTPDRALEQWGIAATARRGGSKNGLDPGKLLSVLAWGAAAEAAARLDSALLATSACCYMWLALRSGLSDETSMLHWWEKVVIPFDCVNRDLNACVLRWSGAGQAACAARVDHHVLACRAKKTPCRDQSW